MRIRVKYLDDQIEQIMRIRQGDWIDLRSRIDYEGQPGDYAEIPLGVAVELPKGFEAHIIPRSSSFKKFGFIQTNSMGLIDESYCGDEDEWKLPVMFVRNGKINKGDRICQFRIEKKMPMITIAVVNSLGNMPRGGFGSTGTN